MPISIKSGTLNVDPVTRWPILMADHGPVLALSDDTQRDWNALIGQRVLITGVTLDTVAWRSRGARRPEQQQILFVGSFRLMPPLPGATRPRMLGR